MSFYLSPPSPDEIFHHGIKGQRWGVRRYQNADGTLTDTGKKRYAQADSALKPGKDGKASKAEKITRSSNDMVNEVKRARKSGKDAKTNSSNNSEARKMSDAELNKRIDRMAREKRYRELKNEQDSINAGRNKVDRALEIIGTTTTIAASAATIATAIYSITKGK